MTKTTQQNRPRPSCSISFNNVEQDDREAIIEIIQSDLSRLGIETRTDRIQATKDFVVVQFNSNTITDTKPLAKRVYSQCKEISEELAEVVQLSTDDQGNSFFEPTINSLTK